MIPKKILVMNGKKSIFAALLKKLTQDHGRK